MYLQWKRAQKQYVCKHCMASILPGTPYLFVRRYGNGYHNIDEYACEVCGDTYDKQKISNVKPERRGLKPNIQWVRIQPTIKYRVVCPRCRAGRIVETEEKAHEWMRTHLHGSFRWSWPGVNPEQAIISLVKDRRFCYDNDEAKVALAASALKWMDIIDMAGFAVDAGQDNCPLCSLYREGGCARCPVFLQTGKKLCEGTPYHDWWTHHWLEHNQWHDLTLHPECPECRILAYNELNFLLSLAEDDSNASLL